MLTLVRHLSAAVAREAMPRAARTYAWMLENEWLAGAHYTLPRSDLTALREVTTRLYRLAVAAAREVAHDEAQLDALHIPSRARAEIRRSLDEPNLFARLDFALVPSGPDRYVPYLLEVNGDTSGNFVEAAVLQPEWGAATGRATASDGMEARVERALAALPGLCVLHHPGDPYIALHGRWLVERAPGATRCEYPQPPTENAATILKVFRWGRLWEGKFPEVADQLGAARARVCEPAWCALLQHKGLLATMWAHAPGMANLLAATLGSAHALPDGGAGGWAEKRFWGIGGEEVLVHAPGTTVPAASAGVVVQARVPPLALAGRYPILCAFLVEGEMVGAIVREDHEPVTRTDRVVPLAVIEPSEMKMT